MSDPNAIVLQELAKGRDSAGQTVSWAMTQSEVQFGRQRGIIFKSSPSSNPNLATY